MQGCRSWCCCISTLLFACQIAISWQRYAEFDIPPDIIHFKKRKEKKGKKREEKAYFLVGGAGLSRFLIKILPVGWRFLLKPEGLDLDKPTARWH